MSKADRKIIKMDEILARDGKANVVFLNYDNEAFMNTGSRRRDFPLPKQKLRENSSLEQTSGIRWNTTTRVDDNRASWRKDSGQGRS